MDKNLQLKRNVNRNYLFTLLQNISFTRGIWMIYLAGKGMSLTQLGLLETIFHIASFTMEVPTGAVADVFGRRTSRIIGRITYLGSVVIMLLSNSFWMFALSFVFSALSYNLESGAGDALIYDSLKEIGEEEQFMKVNGRKELFFQAASTISYLLGGFLAARSYTAAFALTILIAIITVIQSFTFKEPSIGAVRELKSGDNVFIKQIKSSLKEIIKNPKIAPMIIFTQGISALFICIFYFFQNYLKADGFNEEVIGVIYAVSSLTAALTATQVHKIEKRIKEQGILILIPVISIVCIWGIALSQYHYILFIIMMLTESIIFVAVSDYINKMIPSESRATILSFASMVFSFFMITLFPLVGIIGDRYSLSFAFLCLAAIGSILVVLNSCFLLMKESKG